LGLLQVGAKAIVVFTKSGTTVLRASRDRPTVPILAFTADVDTARYLQVLCLKGRGVKGVGFFFRVVFQACVGLTPPAARCHCGGASISRLVSCSI
jgi:hypothetical protein